MRNLLTEILPWKWWLLTSCFMVLYALIGMTTSFSDSFVFPEDDPIRRKLEAAAQQEGFSCLDWKLLYSTLGHLESGPQFKPELLALDNTIVYAAGYVQPLREFEAINQFVLLARATPCYYCVKSPVAGEILVTLAEGQTVETCRDPVILEGTLELAKDPGSPFFYELVNATMKHASSLATRTIDPEHRGEWCARQFTARRGVQVAVKVRNTASE